MIDILINSLGIILQIYAAYLAIRITLLFNQKSFRNEWRLITALIFFFLAGYCGRAYFLIKNSDSLGAEHLLVSMIMLFGAIFVVLTLKLNQKQFRLLKKENREMDTKNAELKILSKGLKKKTVELEKIKTELESKNIELHNLMEDFYTMRLSMEASDKKIKNENKSIKKKLRKIKK